MKMELVYFKLENEKSLSVIKKHALFPYVGAEENEGEGDDGTFWFSCRLLNFIS